jgi:hypothetical protein
MMIDPIRQVISALPSREEKIHRLREFLQHLVLKTAFDRGCFRHIAFMGGTALRILYDLRRFSEDLDFLLANRKGYDFNILASGIVYDLEKSGLKADAKVSRRNNIDVAMLRFRELLSPLGLSPNRSEKLSVHIEVDVNPPRGWRTEISLVNRDFLYTVNHLDLPSLYATKLLACFFRPYTKGRDYYDLLWYLGRRVVPNFELLNNGIAQAEGSNPGLNKANFQGYLREKIRGVDFRKVKKDVERFLDDKREVRLLDKDLIVKMMK